MSHCTCSARALELFVKQIANINIGRSSRVRTTTTCRKPLTARSFVRSLQTANAKFADDTHIPFESSTYQKVPAQRSVDGMKRSKSSSAAQIDDDWHAELSIKASPHETSFPRDVHAAQEVEHMVQPQTSSQRYRTMTVDAVTLREPYPSISTVHDETNSIRLITESPAQMEQQSTEVSQRALARKLRKTLRMKEGRYRPRALRVQQQNSADDQAGILEDNTITEQSESLRQGHTAADIQEPAKALDENEGITSVLDLIEGLEGPDVKLGKPKAIDLQSHKAAKKSKYDKMVAEKATLKAKALLAKPKKQREPWQVQKAALGSKFGESGWQPRKRLSPDTLEGIRAIHASDPGTYTTETLSEHFKVTPEAIRRILKSKWKASEDEETDRRARWERRGVKKWEALANLGVRPPVKWRAMGVGSEQGVKPERMPKRNLKRRGDESGELSWDDVVAGMDEEGGVAARIL